MNIFGTFKQSIEIEQALAELESRFISKEQIIVAFMDNASSPAQLSARTSNIKSNAFEVGVACATGSAVIGASIGFELTWGPIIWGIITTIIGFYIGYSLYYFNKKNRIHLDQRKKEPEILVIIQCTKKQAPQIKELMWQYQALTVGQVNDTSS